MRPEEGAQFLPQWPERGCGSELAGRCDYISLYLVGNDMLCVDCLFYLLGERRRVVTVHRLAHGLPVGVIDEEQRMRKLVGQAVLCAGVIGTDQIKSFPQAFEE